MAVPPEPFHLESWIADQPPGTHAVFDSEFVMHVHKGPCEVVAQPTTTTQTQQQKKHAHGVGAVGATEAFVFQLRGTGEVVQQQQQQQAGEGGGGGGGRGGGGATAGSAVVGAKRLALNGGDMTLVEVSKEWGPAEHYCRC